MFDAIFAPQALLDELGDRAWLQAMLDTERALAEAEATAGVIPPSAAGAIAAACRAELFDSDVIAREGRGVGNPAEPLVRALRAAVGGDAAGYVHYGATSQDIVDTAAMLVSRRALELVLADVAGGHGGLRDARRDASRHSHGRAHAACSRRCRRRSGSRRRPGWPACSRRRSSCWTRALRSRCSWAAAAGTLAALGAYGPEVVTRVAGDLGLAEPVLPWHTSRVRVTALGSALATLAGALGKIALDVVLLAQTEVGEVSEPAGEGRGGSSTMAHKRNPVGSTLTLACARRAQADAGLLIGTLVQEHERAAGAWQAEWDAIAGVLAAAGGAASNMAEVLGGLQIDSERMRLNLAATRGLIMSERLAFALAGRLGPADAKALVSQAVARAADHGTELRDELVADARLPLKTAELDELFAPETYVGAADAFIDRALELYRRD